LGISVILAGSQFEILYSRPVILANSFSIRQAKSIARLEVGVILGINQFQTVNSAGKILWNSFSTRPAKSVLVLTMGVNFDLFGGPATSISQTFPFMKCT
jgi:hypothetical protein